MKKPIPNVNMTRLLEEITQSLSATADGMTMREICEASGKPATRSNLDQIGRAVRDLCVLGRLEFVGKKLAVQIDSTQRRVPAYGLVGEDKTTDQSPVETIVSKTKETKD